MNAKVLQAGIRVERARIDKELVELEAELDAVQAICEHPNAVKVNNGSIGSWYRPGHYWRECECPDCGKKWIEDQ